MSDRVSDLLHKALQTLQPEERDELLDGLALAQLTGGVSAPIFASSGVAARSSLDQERLQSPARVGDRLGPCWCAAEGATRTSARRRLRAVTRFLWGQRVQHGGGNPNISGALPSPRVGPRVGLNTGREVRNHLLDKLEADGRIHSTKVAAGVPAEQLEVEPGHHSALMREHLRKVNICRVDGGSV